MLFKKFLILLFLVSEVALGQSSSSAQKDASATQPGRVNITTQSFAGDKSFSSLLGYTPKNYIINGNFDIWQRGTTTIADANPMVWGSDRWWFYSTNTSDHAITQIAVDAGTDNNYALSMKFTTTNSSYIFATQPMEYEFLKELLGKTVTLAIQYKTSTNTTNGWIFKAYKNTATKNKYDPGTIITSKTLSNSATLVWDSLTFTVPTDVLSFSVEIGSVSNVVLNAEIKIYKVSLTTGSVIVPFSLAAGNAHGELLLCQRYYSKFASYNGVGYSETGTAVELIITSPVIMRTAPTVSWDYTSGAIVCGGGIYNLNARSPAAIEFFSGFSGLASGVASGDAPNYHTLWYKVNNLVLDAELPL